MRRAMHILLLLALVWSAWWGFGSFVMRSTLTTWFDARRAEGWQADMSGLAVSGYPSSFTATLSDPALADPETGLAIAADNLRLEARSIWPGHITLHLPDTPILVASPLERLYLALQDSWMALHLRPGTAGELERAAWLGAAWELTGPSGPLVSAEALQAEMVQTDTPERYRLEFAAPAFRPGSVVREALFVPDNWPLTFDRMALRADITFDRPWDRRALDERRPQPRVIKLALAEAAWADLRIALAADLAIDAEGVPEGTVAVQARNWRTMIDLATRAGLLPPDYREATENTIERLAALSGNPDTLDLQLNLRGGFVAVGFIPVGPAPRFVIR